MVNEVWVQHCEVDGFQSYPQHSNRLTQRDSQSDLVVTEFIRFPPGEDVSENSSALHFFTEMKLSR